jgi:hypothetical protein
VITETPAQRLRRVVEAAKHQTPVYLGEFSQYGDDEAPVASGEGNDRDPHGVWHADGYTCPYCGFGINEAPNYPGHGFFGEPII